MMSKKRIEQLRDQLKWLQSRHVKPFIVFFPAAFLSVTVLAVNLLGDRLRDALDPRTANGL
jgi:ABC-type dipeptide/oligopeptide/nickel transport system permease subunit